MFCYPRVLIQVGDEDSDSGGAIGEGQVEGEDVLSFPQGSVKQDGRHGGKVDDGCRTRQR